jgi:cellulose synthase/poly-beta-1,6-N-acetylglucosamine synthase-like glycosyltransferase
MSLTPDMQHLSVAAILLTANRPEMTAQAVRCFEAQTYPNRRLIIFDTSTGNITRYRGQFQHCEIGGSQKTVGELRNAANALSSEDILVHFDSDDWSHPNRIAEQVALLQSSGADVVGYNRMLFADCRVFGFDSDKMSVVDEDEDSISIGTGNLISTPEAWLYTGEILGTSLCYRRATWERTPFAANHVLNEDGGFVSEVRGKGGKVVAVDSICDLNPFPSLVINLQPRMIARIHAQNSSNPAYNPQQMAAHPRHWQRTPEFDSYCRRMCAA